MGPGSIQTFLREIAVECNINKEERKGTAVW